MGIQSGNYVRGKAMHISAQNPTQHSRWLNVLLLFPAIVGLLCCLPALLCGQQSGKLPIPDDASQQKVVALVGEIYKSDHEAAKTPQQKSALAKKMIDQGIATANDPVSRYVLFRIAGDIAIAAGDAETVLRAIDEMAKSYELDALGAKASALDKTAKAQRLTDESKSLVTQAFRVINEAIANNRFDVASSLGELAIASARKARDGELVKLAVERKKEIDDAEKNFAAVVQALATLDDKPTDPAANLTVGRFRCFVKGDWATGLSMLALGDDSVLKSLAAKELADPSTPDAQLQLGDGWWEVAEMEQGTIRRNIQLRAVHWYRRALPQLTGLPQLRVAKRLEGMPVAPAPSAIPAAVVPPVMPSGAVLLMSFEKNTFTTRGGGIFVQDSSGKNNHGEVHGAVLTEGKVGTALLFDGQDDYVHLPSLRQYLIQDLKAITICAWVRPTKVKSYAFDVGHQATSSISLAVDPPARFVLPTDSGGTETIFDWPTTSGWHHLVGTWNGAEQSIYIDAKLVTKVQTRNLTLNSRTVSDYAARIGSQAKPDRRNERFFAGAIDEFAIFNRALSDEEIRFIYQLGQAGKPLGE
jgi:hypothetical protein